MNMRNAFIAITLLTLLTVTFVIIRNGSDQESATTAIYQEKQLPKIRDKVFLKENTNRLISSVPHSSIATIKAESNDAERLANKHKFFALKNSNIKQDDFGNYHVDISTPGTTSKEYIFSSSPIFYPTEDELNHGLKGCSSGGYYVEIDATISLLMKESAESKIYTYICRFNPNNNDYFLEVVDQDARLSNSINSLLTEEN